MTQGEKNSDRAIPYATGSIQKSWHLMILLKSVINRYTKYLASLEATESIVIVNGLE